MKLLASLLLLLMMITSQAENLVIFDGKSCFADWTTQTPVAGVIEHPGADALHFTIQQWKEGMDGWPRMNFEGKAADLSDYSQIHFEIENPTDQWQDVCLGAHSSREHRSAATGTLAPRSRQKFIVDISDGVGLDPSAINQISFFLIFPKKEQTFIMRRIEAVINPNYVATREALQQRLQLVTRQVNEAAQQAKDAKAIAPAQQELAKVTQAVEARLPGYVAESRAALEKIEETISRTALVERGEPYLIWQSPLGMAMRDVTLPPFGTPKLEAVRHLVAGNEYKALCINLSAAAQPQSVTVELNDDAGGLFGLKPTYLAIARDGTQTADAIGERTRTVTFEVPAFETRQVILWIDTRSRETKPGRYQTRLTMTTGEEKRQLPVEVDVANLRLPDQVPLLVYNWAYFFISMTKVTEGLEKEALANLRDYGVNTWILRYEQSPLPQLDTNGRYTGLTNLEPFRKVMDFLQIRPHEKLMVWLGFQRPEVVALFEDQAVVDAYYRDLRVLLDEYRVPQDGRYIKFIDEPKLDVALQSLDWMEKARKADPALRFFDNGSSPLEEAGPRQRFFSLIDAYSPDWDYGMIARHQEGLNRYIETLHEHDKVKNLGFYRCRMSRKNHGINIEEYYRLGFWRMARYGMGNVGFWVYNAGMGEDEWDGRKGSASGGTVIYRRDDRLLSSRRWELFREGLDDYRLLLALTGSKERLDLKTDPDLLNRVKALLEKADQPAAAETLRVELLERFRPATTTP